MRDIQAFRHLYEGPSAEDVPGLISEMLMQLAGEGDQHVLVKAAMAHLNLVMIHPLSDGNRRMARCLQTLILARDQIVVTSSENPAPSSPGELAEGRI